MSDFRAHERWCPKGATPDGQRRLDIFPEWGDAFPLWSSDQRGLPTLSAQLRSDLRDWNREWEDHAVPGGPCRPWPDEQSWEATGDRLGRRVESETTAVVVVLGPERLGPVPGCVHCGEAAHRAEPGSPLAALLDHLKADFPKQTWLAFDVRRGLTEPDVFADDLDRRHAAELVELERYERDPAAWMRERLLAYLNDIVKTLGHDPARRQAMRYVREGRLGAADLDDRFRDK